MEDQGGLPFTWLICGRSELCCVEDVRSPWGPLSWPPIWIVEVLGREGVPYVLADHVLGACMGMSSLSKSLVITGLPAELLAAATLAGTQR